MGRYFGLQNGKLRKDVINVLLVKLRKLKSWFERQRKFSFVASSLLFIYEGGPITDRSSKQNSRADLTSGNDEVKSSIRDEVSDRAALKRKSTSPTSFDQSSNDELSTDTCGGDSSKCCTKKLKLEVKSDLNEDHRIPLEECQAKPFNNLKDLDFNSKLADVRLIDFAHVFPSTDIDDNYLFGLNNLIHFLEELLCLD